MKLILSRKGFDSGNGKMPSPIFPDGRLCSIPIQSTSTDTLSPYRYGDLSFDGQSIADVLEDLAGGRIRAKDRVHNDPDLDSTAMNRERGWRPLLGQVGSAQAHLQRAGVGPGDLFLFFGWFRQIEKLRGRWRSCTEAPHLHVIFGWLQIDRAVTPSAEVAEELPWAAYHPHFHGKWSPENTLYIARSRLKLSGLTKPTAGGGVFRTFHAVRQLTWPGKTRSRWSLPVAFFPTPGKTPLSYHNNKNRWQRVAGQTLLESAPRGQEFVLDMDEYPGVETWVTSLFEPGADRADRATVRRSSHRPS